MIRILFISPEKTDSCSFYRAGGIAPDLERKYPDCRITVTQWNQIVLHWQVLIGYDLVMLQRPYAKEHLSLCDYVKNLKIPLWVDYDDNLLVVPSENKNFELYNPGTREDIKKILQLADVVTVTTEALKQGFLPFNKNIKVIPNAFNDFVLKNPPIRKGRSPLILWRGSDSHIKDILSMQGPIDQATLAFPEWQFIFMGYFPWYLRDDKRANIFAMGANDVILYFKNTMLMFPAVLHTPLYESPFNRAKSNIAYIEASYFGAATICPDWDEWRKPGALNYTTADSYFELLKGVVKGEINVQAKAEEAWNYIRSELMLSKINLLRQELINTMV
jgi:hypothetical protein